MTLQEALRLKNTDRQRMRWLIWQRVDLIPACREETKGLDDEIIKINNKIKKLQDKLVGLNERKKSIEARYVDTEIERHEAKIAEAIKVLAAADRLIAEEMKRTDDKEEKQNDA